MICCLIIWIILADLIAMQWILMDDLIDIVIRWSVHRVRLLIYWVHRRAEVVASSINSSERIPFEDLSAICIGSTCCVHRYLIWLTLAVQSDSSLQ